MSQPYRLTVARLTGFQTECPDIGTWMGDWGIRLRVHPDVDSVDSFNVSNVRIGMCRNKCVEHARQVGSTHILWIDPDMAIDRYVQRDHEDRVFGRAKPWWDTAWDFVKKHPFAVAAAPYAGKLPERPIHVFVKNEADQLVRVRHEDVKMLTGWTQVAAIGSGLMLTDIRIFDRLEQPYFKDTFTDRTETQLHHSQDIFFSARCELAQIPIYINWDCPCGHWQPTVVEMPGWEKSDGPEPPLPPCAADASIPLLRIQGGGDKVWSK